MAAPSRRARHRRGALSGLRNVAALALWVAGAWRSPRGRHAARPSLRHLPHHRRPLPPPAALTAVWELAVAVAVWSVSAVRGGRRGAHQAPAGAARHGRRTGRTKPDTPVQALSLRVRLTVVAVALLMFFVVSLLATRSS